jgi:hypothetical protein
MPTRETKTIDCKPNHASISPLACMPTETLKESVFMLSLLACMRVLCEERGWTHTGYFLEKAQESLMEADES